MFVNAGNWNYTYDNESADALYPKQPSNDFPGGCEHQVFDGPEGFGVYARSLPYRQ